MLKKVLLDYLTYRFIIQSDYRESTVLGKIKINEEIFGRVEN